MLSIDDLFKGRHFDREIIILCVRWYLRFKLSFRDLVEMIAERGISLAHTTIMRWIQRYLPRYSPCPTPAAKHFVAVAFHRPMDLLQGSKVPGNAVIGIVAPQDGLVTLSVGLPFSDFSRNHR
jgi:hypothetical protein